jgi:hypothetical protein
LEVVAQLESSRDCYLTSVTPAAQYTLYLTLQDDQGREHPDVLEWTQEQIIRQFGGLTPLPECKGMWRSPFDQKLYLTFTIPLECITSSSDENDDWFCDLAEDIAARLGCQEVLIFKAIGEKIQVRFQESSISP